MNRSKNKGLAYPAGIVLAFSLVVVLIIAFSTASASASSRRSVLSLQTPTIGFKNTTYTVSEGGIISIDVEMSTAAGTSTTVEYLTLDGTAKAGVDYVSAAGVLTFVAGDLSESFLIQTIQNSNYSGDRTVNLVLRNPSVGTILNPSKATAVLVIQEDEATPTPTSQGATATAIFTDRYEPNNTLQNAFPTSPGAAALCSATLWPAGDVDWYRFVGKAGSAYEVFTKELTAGLDTVLSVYDTTGRLISTNDDADFGSRASKVVFSAGANGNYYARIINNNNVDPANKTYCFAVTEIAGTATATAFPTGTRVPGVDICEYNGDFDSACLIGAGDSFDMNLVPLWGEGPDNDFFRLWVKPGLLYTCETFALSSVNDTNMILYDQNHNGLGGNDDRAVGDFSSQVSWYANYTGWLYVLVGPVSPPEYALSFLYTYSVRCIETVATPTATPQPTFPPSSGQIIRPPTSTPTPIATDPFTPTPFTSDVTVIPVMTPTPTPNIQVIPLPTNTPATTTGQTVSFDLTVYYDENLNFSPELTEGVENVAVQIYDNLTNELMAFGYTNEAGTVRFSSLTLSGMIRISIPFLQYSQVTTGTSNIFIRVAPVVQQAKPQ
ncbi:MAG TPA: Calx-beta domain-containing protein [Patescibacteria group bacterium]|nr:Calx-beta domain-containing protein [Patescibacteria group bacterium]